MKDNPPVCTNNPLRLASSAPLPNQGEALQTARFTQRGPKLATGKSN